MRTQWLILSFVLLTAAVMPSCKRNPFRHKVSSIKVNIEVRRLEEDLFETDPIDIPGKVPELLGKYKDFLQLFSYVINAGEIKDSAFTDVLARFCTDKQNNEVYRLTKSKYPDVARIKKGLDEAFSNYLYYFPERKVPAVYTCITGFNNSIITGDSSIGISLDRYLGSDCKYYPELEIFSYIAARMTPENVVPDCIYGWGASEWEFSSLKYKPENVLAEMIHDGKLRYFEKCMLPDVNDETIFGFNPEQMMFCRKNEGQMWQYLIENELIFKTDQLTIKKLTGEAPFTSYFSNKSPGRAAVWIGFRIVESYMIKNQGTSLGDLMNNTDIQLILEKARYNPK